jgi:hypothetical protein
VAAATTLTSRRADASATRRTRAAGTADEPGATGVLRTGGAPTPLGGAVARGSQALPAEEYGGECAGTSQPLERPAP